MGNEVSVLDKIERISEVLADYGLETVVLVGQLEMDRRSRTSLSLKRVKSIAYVDLLDRSAKSLSFHRGSAYDPLWVLFSSGTSESSLNLELSIWCAAKLTMLPNSRDPQSHHPCSVRISPRLEESGSDSRQPQAG